MKLDFDWQDPILLAKNRIIIVSDEDVRGIDNVPGIYFFARMYGRTATPFYIGETLTLRARLVTHLDTRRIADVLRGIPVPGAPSINQGRRMFYYAYFKAKRGQTAKRCISIAQRFMIQEAVSKGTPLINLQLTTIKAHTISFSGSASNRGGFKVENLVPE
jgi:hypothetical protein